MSTNSDQWQLGAVLQNLSLDYEGPDEISFPGSPYHLVSGKDQRIWEFAQNCEYDDVAHFLRAFRDDQGNKYSPAAIIAASGSPVRKDLRHQSLAAFRNVVAFSLILKNHATSLTLINNLPANPSFSDTFDIFPANFSQTGSVNLVTPAKTFLFHPMDTFLATNSPALPLQKGIRFFPDPYLFKSLGLAWTTHFKSRGPLNSYFTALFRSLEVAYRAATANYNPASQYDYGTNIALWVSAIEILGHPQQGHVNPEKVIELLDKYKWQYPRFNKTTYQNPPAQRSRKGNRNAKKKTPIKAISKFYMLMYHARNDYLHGNPVTVKSLQKRVKKRLVTLPSAAPMVYRTALASYLEKQYRNLPPPVEDKERYIPYLRYKMQYSRALQVLIDGKDEDL